MRLLLALIGSLLLGGSGGAAETSAPAWPAHGCAEHTHVIFDFATDAAARPTRRAAAAAYLEVGDRLVRHAAPGPHDRPTWLVVTPRNEIRASLTMAHFPQGFVVDSVEKCAG